MKPSWVWILLSQTIIEIMVPLTQSSSTEDPETELPNKASARGTTQPRLTYCSRLPYLHSTCAVLPASPGMLLLACRYEEAPNTWPSLPPEPLKGPGVFFSRLLSFSIEAGVPPGPPASGYSLWVLDRIGEQIVRMVHISTWLLEPPQHSFLRR